MKNLKYKFDDLVGNQLNISLLRRSIDNNTFRQFTIFSGVLGTGKSTCSRISAMALTCENPNNGQPCCNCSVCRENMKAFELGIDSPYVRTINAAKIVTKEDVQTLVHDIFDLQGSARNRVFLIEEAHALAKVTNAQTVLLSELDTMPSNVYILFSTTRLFELTEELKSRAEIYTFGRLSDAESKQLIESAAEHRGYRIPTEILNLIVKQGKGIPRNILKALDFTIDEGVSLSELRAHLQVVDDSQLVQLFESMASPQIQYYADTVESIKCAVGAQDFLQSLKSFIVQVTFVIEGDLAASFNYDELLVIKSIFTREKLYKIVSLLDNSARKISDSELDILLLHLRLIMQQRTTSDVIVDSRKIGAVEKDNTAERQAVESKAANTATMKKITLDGVKRLQGK